MDVKTTFLHGDLDKEIYMEQPEGFQVKGKEDYRFGDDDFIILLLYVDDMMIVGKNIGRITQLKQDLSKSFAMKDCGTAKQILGIRIFHDRGAKKLHISQEQYIEKVLRRFNMDKAKVIEFHMYAIVCTRTNLAHAVGVVSRFLSNPGITFGNGKPMLVGYTDLDLAGNKDNMKSTSGYLMTFVGGAISWQSRLQKCVSLSTTEDEYVAATEACKELLWLKRTKHIDIRYHWIRDAIEDGMFELNKVHTDDNASDMLTKAIAREKLKIWHPYAHYKVWKNKREESKRKEKKKKIFGVLITQNPAAVFRRSPEFSPSDHHDFWTEASLHIKEGFDRWDLDFEVWKFCFLPGQIASCLVIFIISCSLFVAIYLDIDSKIMMIVVCL
ncbi:retrovirus-related pol polyprotein from transposon TNT 1-94 [Tanacetum coccineum]